MGIIQDWRAALAAHAGEARQAKVLLDSYVTAPLPRVPGMDTMSRLALRIFYGRTIEQAAAREYLYRWNLAILPPDQVIQPDSDRNTAYWNRRDDRAVSIFGTPHAIGM